MKKIYLLHIFSPLAQVTCYYKPFKISEKYHAIASTASLTRTIILASSRLTSMQAGMKKEQAQWGI